MNIKVTLKYLVSSFILIVISFSISYHYWWKINLNSAQFFIIVFSTMICWIGIGFLSILISGKIIFKDIDNIGFVSPFTLALNGYFQEKFGLETAKKFKTTFSLIAFPFLIFLIFTFYKITDFVEYTDLSYYGIERSSKIEEISYYKGQKQGKFIYNFDGENYSKILFLEDTLKGKGDYDTIIFSSRNPNIAEIKITFLEKTKK